MDAANGRSAKSAASSASPTPTPMSAPDAQEKPAQRATKTAQKEKPKSPAKPKPSAPKLYAMAMYAGGKEAHKFRIPFSHPQTPVSEFRQTICDVLHDNGEERVEPERVRIVFMGKILNETDRDGNPATLFMYDVKNSYTVTIQIRPKDFVPLERAEGDLPAAMDLDGDGATSGAAASVEEASGSAEREGGTAAQAQAETGLTDMTDEDRKLAEQMQEEDEKCDKCKKKPGRKCKDCNCCYCGVDEDAGNCMLCDECQYWHHLKCLPTPPPESEWDAIKAQEEWYCPSCSNKNKVVNAVGGEGSKKAQSRGVQSGRRWGGGMANVGRSKVSTVVDKDHMGPVPGVEVGQMWLYRMAVSEDGVHGPPVGGISGSSKTGCRSIVLSGGYPEDEDYGETFTYTGSGGRDLKSENRRTAKQDSDQKLEKANLAIAITCDAARVDDVKGAVASDWRKSKPIRVLRSSKLIKEAKKKNIGVEYVPTETGYRYDGIYKLVRYWPERNSSGFLNWRYEFKRDDPAPPPWTEEGKKRIKELGLKLIDRGSPADGDGESKKRKRDGAENGEATTDKSKKTKGSGKGAKAMGETEETSAPKRQYKPPQDVLDLIAKDVHDAKVWEDVLSRDATNPKEFFEVLEKEFECPVCFDMVKDPFMIPCHHNICKDCTTRALKSVGKKQCALCKTPFEDEHKQVNKELVAIFKALRG
ncbi:hypothetical protein M427DRAFT_52841 [Gonapodya prolifera JEL478]|uniref:RING-type E3 ubiquitin transferase n=1 Tax=Gonapodya prolifera (strain JEL478) TaxID=1344416 RepID=A0A139AS88_GONPJ|nr:hypothetical protein M427DRAFT_52841 [Gonapodya prolifera JEL478]|eukprot:KXS19403.1 hypothetical protein M427DRAFT_52841 [Gonapodya prolifera JEL478]